MGSNSIDQLHKEKKKPDYEARGIIDKSNFSLAAMWVILHVITDISTIILFSATYPQFPLAVTS